MRTGAGPIEQLFDGQPRLVPSIIGTDNTLKVGENDLYVVIGSFDARKPHDGEHLRCFARFEILEVTELPEGPEALDIVAGVLTVGRAKRLATLTRVTREGTPIGWLLQVPTEPETQD